MKGIILAGGQGSRLYPSTQVISKQLLPIFDKPLIYYPLSMLMLAEIREILIITTERDNCAFQTLLGDGSKLGLKIEYAVQKEPKGIGQAFLIGEKFIADDDVCLILGDNLFHGSGLTPFLLECKNTVKSNNEAVLFAYEVPNPKDFGVIDFDENGKAVSLEEKPKNPKSDYAVPGMYFYPNDVVEIAKKMKPSARGELEITSINNEYLDQKRLNAIKLRRGVTWLDTGTPLGLYQASTYVYAIQNNTGKYISCIEEIAYLKGYITKDEFLLLGKELENSDYGKYILKIAKKL